MMLDVFLPASQTDSLGMALNLADIQVQCSLKLFRGLAAWYRILTIALKCSCSTRARPLDAPQTTDVLGPQTIEF